MNVIALVFVSQCHDLGAQADAPGPRAAASALVRRCLKLGWAIPELPMGDAVADEAAVFVKRCMCREVKLRAKKAGEDFVYPVTIEEAQVYINALGHCPAFLYAGILRLLAAVMPTLKPKVGIQIAIGTILAPGISPVCVQVAARLLQTCAAQVEKFSAPVDVIHALLEAAAVLAGKQIALAIVACMSKGGAPEELAPSIAQALMEAGAQSVEDDDHGTDIFGQVVALAEGLNSAQAAAVCDAILGPTFELYANSPDAAIPLSKVLSATVEAAKGRCESCAVLLDAWLDHEELAMLMATETCRVAAAVVMHYPQLAERAAALAQVVMTCADTDVVTGSERATALSLAATLIGKYPQQFTSAFAPLAFGFLAEPVGKDRGLSLALFCAAVEATAAALVSDPGLASHIRVEAAALFCQHAFKRLNTLREIAAGVVVSAGLLDLGIEIDTVAGVGEQLCRAYVKGKDIKGKAAAERKREKQELAAADPDADEDDDDEAGEEEEEEEEEEEDDDEAIEDTSDDWRISTPTPLDTLDAKTIYLQAAAKRGLKVDLSFPAE